MPTLFDVHMPHMGVVERALLTAWLVSPGDRVAESDPLCEVSTDKVDTEIASPASGVLIDQLIAVNDEVPVGAVIARFAPLDAREEEIAEAIRQSAELPRTASESAPLVELPQNGHGSSQPAGAADAAPRSMPVPVAAVDLPEGASLVLQAAWWPAPASAVQETPGQPRRVPSTPPVRKLAKELGMDLKTVNGTGPGGRVTRKDVEAAAVASTSDLAVAPAPAAVSTAASVARGSGVVGSPTGYESVAHEAVALSPQRQAIARNLLESVTTAPQVTAQVDVDMSAVVQARSELNELRIARGEAKLSFLPFIARALCAVVAEHPDLNATFTDTHLLRWRPINLGIAVDAPQGLLVPVVRNAETRTIFSLADAIAGVSARVQNRQVTQEVLASGTITISNSGSVGGVTATPILTRPQVASLGVPAIIRTPVVVTSQTGEEYVSIRPIARLGLTFDHRAFDGAQALRALRSLQGKLEQWSAEAYL
ncbi:dihydrolipoamide acetyltransferase family protein [Saccharopolyspora sp. NPDC000995]